MPYGDDGNTGLDSSKIVFVDTSWYTAAVDVAIIFVILFFRHEFNTFKVHCTLVSKVNFGFLIESDTLILAAR